MSHSRNKKIVFVNQSSGYLMIDIINAFSDQYEERILITGFLNPRNNPLDADVKVEQMISYNRSSGFKRLLTWGLGFIKALWLIKIKYRKADLFLVSNPPLAPLIPLFCANPCKILIYDIYPDALVEFGYFKNNSWFIKLWGKANKKVFGSAERIYTLTSGMAKRVSNYIAQENVTVVPIWTDNFFFKPVAKDQNPFVKEMAWENKFIVMYSGNLGKSHPVEILVELAKRVDDSNIQFCIIGGGDKFEMIKGLIEDSNLSNIILLPLQATEKLPYTLSAADLALVTIGEEVAELSIPSKAFNLLSAGVPIFGISPINSALADLIQSENIGQNFMSSQLEDMMAFITDLKKNSKIRAQLVANALASSKKFLPENAKNFI